jgi:hypothetical protein
MGFPICVPARAPATSTGSMQQRGHKAISNGSGLRIERVPQVWHVEGKPAEAADMFSEIGADAGDQVGGDGMSVVCHGVEDLRQVCNVGQHYRIGDEAGVFYLLLLLDRITARDHRAAEANPVEKFVVGTSFGTSSPSSREPIPYRIRNKPHTFACSHLRRRQARLRCPAFSH